MLIACFFVQSSLFIGSDPRGPLECQEGVSGSSKNSCRKVLFQNRALYVRNVNRVSNSCESSLIGYYYFGDCTYLGLFFMQNYVKGYDFWKSYIFMVVLQSFVIFKKICV